MVKAVHAWKPISNRPIGRPKICWEDDVKKIYRGLKVPNWKTLVQDRRREGSGWEGQNSALRIVEPC